MYHTLLPYQGSSSAIETLQLMIAASYNLFGDMFDIFKICYLDFCKSGHKDILLKF